MAYYENTRKQSELSNNLEIKYLNYMNKIQKDFDNDIIPGIIDTRSRYDKLNDQDYINQQLTKLAYNLFDNDPEQSEEFINLFKRNGTSYSRFSVIYDTLYKQIQGTDAEPNFVFSTAIKLIDNIVNTGSANNNFNSTTIIDNLEELKDNINNFNFNNKFEEKQTTQKLDALKYLYENIFSSDTEISFEDTDNLSKTQFTTIKGDMMETINSIIAVLVSNDIDEDEKQIKILKLLNTVKETSISKITNLIKKGKISYK